MHVYHLDCCTMCPRGQSAISGEGTLANATGLTIPAMGPAESATIFEYTSPASGTSEAVLKLKPEEGAAYTEAEAHVKY